jgi:hypothetical protein
MRVRLMVLLGAVLLVSPALAQTPGVLDAEQAALAGAVHSEL